MPADIRRLIQEVINLSSKNENISLTLDELEIKLENCDKQKGKASKKTLQGQLKCSIEEKQEVEKELSNAKYQLYIACSYQECKPESNVWMNEILELIYEHEQLDLFLIYSALYSSSCKLLEQFCNHEEEYLSTLSFRKFPSSRIVLCQSVSNKKHFLEYIYDKILCGAASTPSLWRDKFDLLLSLEQWDKSEKKYQDLSLLDNGLINYSHCSDVMLTFIVKQKIQNIKITQTCLQHYSHTKANKLLDLLDEHTVLYAIHSSLPYHKMPYQSTLSILSSPYLNNQNEGLNSECIATYQAYSAISFALQIINAGIELDRIAQVVQYKNFRENTPASKQSIYVDSVSSFYTKHIASKWERVKDIIESVTLPKYRLELLENLYSFIFIQHRHLSDNVDDSMIDEGEQTSPPSVIMEKEDGASKSSVTSSLDDVDICNADVSEDLILKDPFLRGCEAECFSDKELLACLSPDSSEAHSDNKSSSTNVKMATNSDFSSGSSITDFSNCGFLCNLLVAWDLLLLLEDQLAKFKEAVFTPEYNSAENINKYNYLVEKVAEALWRISIVIPHSRVIGSTSEIEIYINGKIMHTSDSEVIFGSGNVDSKCVRKCSLKKRNRNKKSSALLMPVTNILHASPIDLFNVTLAKENFAEAHKVLLKYDLSSGLHSQELVVREILHKFIPQLEHCYSDECLNTKGDQCSMEGLQDMFTENSSKVILTELINEVVSVFTNAITEGHHGLFSKLYPQFILSDIGLTSQLSENQALELFSYSSDTVFTHLSPWTQAFMCRYQDLVALCKQFVHRENFQKKSYYDFLFLTNSIPQNVLLSRFPLKNDMRQYFDSWNSIIQQLFSCKILSGNDDRKMEQNCCDAYKELMKTIGASSNYIFSGTTHPPDYMSLFYDYLELLNTVLQSYTKDRSSIMFSFFDLLSSRPVSLLGDLMFLQGICPKKLEEISNRMKVDLLSIIQKYSFPATETLYLSDNTDFNSFGRNKEKLESFGCSEWTGKIWILNAGSFTCKKPIHGEVFVRDILSSLLDAIKDISSNSIRYNTGNLILDDIHIQNSLKETSDLASTDLLKLTPGDEALSFFVNLANLMFIHVAILNSLLFHGDCKYGIFSNSDLETLLDMKKVGYLIGQLGFVSLFDLLYVILKLPLNSKYEFVWAAHIKPKQWTTILDSLITNIPPYLLFCVTRGVESSPRVQLFYSDSFTDDCHFAVNKYISSFYVCDGTDSAKADINQTMLDFIEFFIKGANFVIEDLAKILLPENLPFLNIIRKVGETKAKSRRDVKEGRFIILDSDYANDFTGCTVVDDSLNIKKTCVEIPSHILLYLKETCPLLGILIERYNIPKTKEKVFNLKERVTYPYSIGNVSEICDPTCLINLLNLDAIKCLSSLTDTGHILPALTYIPKLSSIYSFLESSLIHDREYQLTMFKMLSALPSYVFFQHPELEELKDSIAVELLCKPDNDGAMGSLQYFFHIQNPVVALRVLKTHHPQWPLESILDFLQQLSFDSRLPKEDCDWVLKRRSQILNYDQIAKLHKSKFKSWREVDEASTDTPDEVLLFMIKEGRYSLGVEWFHYQTLSGETLFLANVCCLHYYLDNNSPDFDGAMKCLKTLTIAQLVDAAECLLLRLFLPSTRKFLIAYFLEQMSKLSSQTWAGLVKREFHPSFTKFKLQQELMGLLLIDSADSKTVDEYQLVSLARSPYLIIEQSLMNLKFEFVENGINTISEYLESVICPKEDIEEGECLCRDHFTSLIENYAFKAVELSGIQISFNSPLPTDPPLKFIMPEHVPQRTQWQNNSSVTRCSACDVTTFSLFSRRHHCRRCGRVVCDGCSDKRLLIPGYQNVLVRVCVDCYAALTKESIRQTVPLKKEVADGEQSPFVERDEHIKLEMEWYLSSDSRHNTCVRKEFSYEWTPSLNLCHSLLFLHRDDCKAAISASKLCLKLLSAVVESVEAECSELDKDFVLQMIRSLVAYAKLKFGGLSNHDGVVSCEYIDQWTVILKLLSESECLPLLQKGCLDNVLCIIEQRLISEPESNRIRDLLIQEYRFMRTLRDNLVKNENWELALNISTKAGLEASGVWGARGMASLKAGHFPVARDHFAKALPKVTDKHITVRSSLLKEILSYLESKPFSMQSFPYSFQKSQSTTESLVVLHALQSLNDISNGVLSDTHSGDPFLYTKKPSQLEPLFSNECEHYLSLYGCHRMHVQFYMRHGKILESIKYCQDHQVQSNIFIEHVLLVGLKKGTTKTVLSYMRVTDTQEKWYASTIFSACQWLEKKHHFHCLLEIQECLFDHVRAAITLIRMYVTSADSFTALTLRKHYLQAADTHLREYLNDMPLKINEKVENVHDCPPSVILQWTSWKVNRQLSFITFQSDITNYLSALESKESIQPLIKTIRAAVHNLDPAVDALYRVPSVFRKEDRLVIGIACILAGSDLEEGLSLAYRLVETNSVLVKDLVHYVPIILLELDRNFYIKGFMKSIIEWGLISQAELEDALRPAILIAGRNYSQEILDGLLSYLPNATDKIDAYIDTGKLKAAFVLVVERGRVEEMKRLAAAAAPDAANQPYVAKLCLQWLNYESKRR